MKLDKLTIANFKNLQNFSIDFDETSLTTVIVGGNGTGKSNLLEAIILIFRDLDLQEPPAFKYQIEYTCRNKWVRIEADPDRTTGRVRVMARDVKESPGSEKVLPYTTVWQKERRNYLPSYVFGYYSGPSNRMESHFEKHQNYFYKDLIKGVEQPLRPLLYARLVHSQFVLLSFFIEQDQKILQFLEKHLRIVGLESILFVMRQPPWPSNEGDPRFWYARGVVQKFLSELYSLAFAPLRMEHRLETAYTDSNKAVEHLYLYLPNLKTLQELANRFIQQNGSYVTEEVETIGGGDTSQQQFFKALESTYIAKLISEVRTRVKLREADGALIFRDLSEGEQQLLMVLGLLRFTREKEALFLLDEPDTHLNPAWGIKYIDFLNEVVDMPDTTHIIMTTHDPLVLTGLTKSQVQVMWRSEQHERIVTQPPMEDPKGMGVEWILTSELFGLKTTLDPGTQDKLDRRNALLVKLNRTEEENIEMMQLSDDLASKGFARTIRDAMYEKFIRAVSQHPEFKRPVLNPEEIKNQQRLADAIIDEILSGEEQ